MAGPEEKAERYQKALVALVSDIQRSELTPLFKEGFLIDRCQAPADGARTFVDAAINDFHGRMQRCLVRCQDKAKDEMPAVSPSESDIRKAQGRLAGCYAECAVEYERQLPKFGQDVRSQLRRALKQ